MESLESRSDVLFSPEKVALFQTRFEENYDLTDPEYVAWLKNFHPKADVSDTDVLVELKEKEREKLEKEEEKIAKRQEMERRKNEWEEKKRQKEERQQERE